jgi:protein-tyrosine phosphatase
MGNICRSPTAQGVFEKLVEAAGLSGLIETDSAGTHAYHVGEPPDRRAQEAAVRRGVALHAQRARRVEDADFESFDYIVAMDYGNMEDLRGMCPPGHEHKLRLLLEFAPELPEMEVPDPYYGGARGFERVLDLVEVAARGLLEELRQRHNL